MIFFAITSFLMWQKRATLRFESVDLAVTLFVILSIITGILFTGEGFPANVAQIVWGAKYGLLFFVTFFFVRQLSFSAKQTKLLFACALVPATLVIAFGLAQKTIFPEDFLIQFGYNSEYGVTETGQGLSYCHKIENRITHEEFCRVQSTLSGPNQLGAYLLVVLPLLLFFALSLSNLWQRIGVLTIVMMGIAVLFLTWSRSAWIGLLAATAALFVVQAARPFVALAYLALFGGGIVALFFPALFIEHWDKLKIVAVVLASAFWILLAAMMTWNIPKQAFSQMASVLFPLFLGGMIAVRMLADTFFWNIILRPSSSQGHWERWSDGVFYIIKYPLGLGLGDAGPASARFARPGETGFLPESWYLQVGLESGVLGLILFLTILALVAYLLLKSATWQAKALLVGLVGVSSASLFLHSWESAVVALTFWILAGVALSFDEQLSLGQRLRLFFSHFARK